MDETHTYDLAFVGPGRRPYTAPEIIFSIAEQHLPEVIDRLQIMAERLTKYAETYLGTPTANFTLPVPDLFGHQECGYGKCGYWTTDRTRVHFHLQLRPHPRTDEVALTIFILTRVLSFPFKNGAPSNRAQDAALQTSCAYDRMHGHAIGGWLSEDITGWLRNYAAHHVRSNGSAAMHPDVIRAMQAAWYAISTKKMQQYTSTRDIYGWVQTSGAFSLNCFGNACDLSVYPDQIHGSDYDGVEFGCHNLDRGDQQLTLLAGLAKICELARAST